MNFYSNSFPTVGVEEEFHIIDPASGELVSASSDFLRIIGEQKHDTVCRELLECIIEQRSSVFGDVNLLAESLMENRLKLQEVAGRLDLKIAAAGTHPFSEWRSQRVVDDEHYNWVQDNYHSVARRLLAMGLHIHVGVKNSDVAFYVLNRIRKWIPSLMSLSCNSPFFEADDYGYKSTRMHLFRSLPRTGFLPDFNNFDEYQEFYDKLKLCGDVISMKDMWWMARPKPEFGTVEFRIFDIPTSINRIVAIAALVQAAVAKFQDDYFVGVPRVVCNQAYLDECEWKSYRDGVDAVVIDPETGAITTCREMIVELMQEVNLKAKELNSLELLKGVDQILNLGTEADYLKKLYYDQGYDLKDIELDVAKRTMEL